MDNGENNRNLGEEVKQPSNPFMNLSQRGLIRSQLNALTAMIPSLDMSEKKLPRGSTDVGNGYALLRARDAMQSLIVDCDEVEAIRQYFAENSQPVNPNWMAKVQRWARLRLPNGQQHDLIGRRRTSLWGSSGCPGMSRLVGIKQQNTL